MANATGIESMSMFFLGGLSALNLQSGERDKDVQLIDLIEEAHVSNNGFKVIEISTGNVVHRHPLHAIAQIVFYNDPKEKNNLVFKIEREEKQSFDCLVFQCQDEEVAVRVCETFKSLFDMFLNVRDDNSYITQKMCNE